MGRTYQFQHICTKTHPHQKVICNPLILTAEFSCIYQHNSTFMTNLEN